MNQPLQVFTCNDFAGHWPVGTAAVIVATSAAEADTILRDELHKHGLLDENPPGSYTIVGMAFMKGSVRILSDGEY